nr:uncharacterized protein [uncultured bacterium]
MTSLDERISNLESGRLFVAPISDALNKTFLLKKRSSVIPALAVEFQGVNYLISHAPLYNATEIRINGKFLKISSYARYLGRNSTYGICVYKVLSSALPVFPWFTDTLYEGQSVFSVGPHTMGLTLETLSFGVADGIVSKTERDLSTNIGDEYIQHTAEMFHSLYGSSILHTFGPLFTIKNEQPYLIGLNSTFGYIDNNDPSYIGVTFAHSRKNIELAIQNIIGG